MRKTKQRFLKALSVLLLGFFVMTSLAPRIIPKAKADYMEGESFYDPKYELSSLNAVRYAPTLDASSTGAFIYDFPMQLPPGRNGMEPHLSLSYNSQMNNQQNTVGYGWSLNIPFISRLNKTGVDKLYEDNYFTSSMDGELVAVSLTDDVHGEYAAKIENGEFRIYKYDASGYWTITDKNGVTYTFGSSEDTRQDDPDDSTTVYTWMLEETRDTNDNFVSYGYSKELGEIYPSQITYTGDGTTEGIFDIEFTLESRDDQATQYNKGFQVSTYSRIATITIEKEDQWLRKYSLDYDPPDVGEKSLLASVTEQGRAEDGTEVTLPSTEFTYTEPSKSWTDQSASYYEVLSGGFFATSNSHYRYSNAGRMVDVNGDALPDFLWSIIAGTELSGSVYVNQNVMGSNTAVEEDSSFTIPVPFMEQSTHFDQGTRFADINGDGLIDLLKKIGDSDDGVYINQGDGTWSLDSGYNFPIDLVGIDPRTLATRDNGARLFDVNGDGFADLVWAMEYQGDGSSTVALNSVVCINNADGTGWTEDSDFELPIGFIDYAEGIDRGVRILDMNADGLLDFIKSYSGEDATDYCVTYEQCLPNGVYINQGDGTWEIPDYSSSFDNPPLSFVEGGPPQDIGSRIMDINGDGLDDLVYSINGTSQAYINMDGMSWKQDTAYTLPIDFVNTSGMIGDNGSRLDDLNGDGLVDFVASGENNYEVYLTDGSPANILESITSGKGSSVEIEYKGSAEYLHQDSESGPKELNNPDLPFSIQTVSEITTEDGLGASATISYDYSGGAYLYEDELNRQFAGFASITKTEDGRITETFYEQDEFPLLGKAYQTDIYDGDGNLYTRTVDTWETTDLGYENDFAYKSQTATLTYDGESSHRDTGTAYTYDSYGNLKTAINYGEVAADADGAFTDITDLDEKFTVTYNYSSDTGSGSIRNKVREEKITNSSGATIKRTLYYYDSLSFGKVSVGNLTRQANWYDVTNIWHNTYFTYNSYGLVTSTKNPRGYFTGFAYDTYKLYPFVTTNPKSHTVSTKYDYATGQMTSRTDENGFTSETVYDGFGRVTSVSVPNPTTGTTTELSTTSYDDTSVPTSVTTASTVDGVSSESVTYFDGFGRIVQTNTLAEDGVYNTVDTWYDELGNISEQTLPYETTSSAYERDDSQYSVTTVYDALNRPLTVTSPTGITTYDYSQWENTVTDANAVSKVYNYDAAGHLLGVEEQNDGDSYTTTYAYDTLGQLITLTDAQDNVRNFDYDSLGRKISQEDLHDASETSFGTWTYTYDKNNNLSTQTDPAGQTITWAYDQLDRVTYEDWDTSTTAREVQYTYDYAANKAIGRLYRIKMGSYNTYYAYDAQGNTITDHRNPSGTGLTLKTAYDLLGRPTKITYPSSALTVNYAYNETGALETVTHGTTTLTDVVSDFDYSPMGQIEYTAYGNGMTTTNTYDPAQAYRLTSKVTGNSRDTDGDGLTDAEESLYGTDVNDTDSDDDGLSDYAEVITHLTDPLDSDSDDDTYSDYDEVAAGSNPSDASSNPSDIDGDGLYNSEEAALGTDPADSDSDDDGLTDRDEVNTYSTDPLDNDSDGDLFTDGYEVTKGADALDSANMPKLTVTFIGHRVFSGYGDTSDWYNTTVYYSSTQDWDVTDGEASYVTMYYYQYGALGVSWDKTEYLGSIEVQYCGWDLAPFNPTGSTCSSIKEYADSSDPDSEATHVSDSSQLERWADLSGTYTFEDWEWYRPRVRSSTSTAYYNAFEINLISTPLTSSTGLLDRLWAWLVPAADASTVSSSQDLTYTYDSVGNITGIVDSSNTATNKTLTYTYDDLNRLLTAASSGLSAGDYSESYNYDEVGNLVCKSNLSSEDCAAGDTNLLYEGTGSQSGSYSGANPHAVTSVLTASGTSTLYTYDDNGNLTSNTAHSYTWDKRNRLTGGVSADGTTKTFTYDYTGSRYKTVNSSTGTTDYYLGRYMEIRDFSDGSGTAPASSGTITYYIFAGSQRVAAYEDSDGDGTREMYYYHQDHLGGTSLVTDETGEVAQLYDYYPYGSELLNENPTSADAPSEHSFTDKELDDDLGLYYFEARWYDSEIGRFSSQDPAQLDNRVFKLIQDPQSLNHYSYSRNNPVALTDPTGESFISDFANGFVNAWYSNNAFGAGRYNNPDNAAYSAGQFLGDATAMLTGAMEVVAGSSIAGGGAAGGLAFAPATGGTSVVAGAGAATAGYTLAGHGATTMLSSGQNLGQDLNAMVGDNSNGYGTTPDGRSYTKHGYARAEIRNISGEQIDNTINNYTDKFDASKGKTGYYDSVNDLTVITGDHGEIVTTHQGVPVQLKNPE